MPLSMTFLVPRGHPGSCARLQLLTVHSVPVLRVPEPGLTDWIPNTDSGWPKPNFPRYLILPSEPLLYVPSPLCFIRHKKGLGYTYTSLVWFSLAERSWHGNSCAQTTMALLWNGLCRTHQGRSDKIFLDQAGLMSRVTASF